MNRREMLGLAAAAPLAISGALAQENSPDPASPARNSEAISGTESSSLIDVNVNLFRWPLRRLHCDETPTLVQKLRESNVQKAWAGSFEGLLHRDIAGVNSRLATECKAHGDGILVPFGSINPMLPDWEDDLRRCAEDHRMPGIRLHPNYHGYELDTPEFERVLQGASSHGMCVQIAIHMEDERMMNPRLRVPPVQLAPLADVVKRVRLARVVLLNTLSTSLLPPLLAALGAGDVHVDISMLEGVGGLGRLLAQVPLDRVLFGSHAPLFYYESAVLKLRETPLSDAQLLAIRSGNAKKLLATHNIA